MRRCVLERVLVLVRVPALVQVRHGALVRAALQLHRCCTTSRVYCSLLSLPCDRHPSSPVRACGVGLHGLTTIKISSDARLGGVDGVQPRSPASAKASATPRCNGVVSSHGDSSAGLLRRCVSFCRDVQCQLFHKQVV